MIFYSFHKTLPRRRPNIIFRSRRFSDLINYVSKMFYSLVILTYNDPFPQFQAITVNLTVRERQPRKRRPLDRTRSSSSIAQLYKREAWCKSRSDLHILGLGRFCLCFANNDTYYSSISLNSSFCSETCVCVCVCWGRRICYPT